MPTRRTAAASKDMDNLFFHKYYLRSNKIQCYLSLSIGDLEKSYIEFVYIHHQQLEPYVQSKNLFYENYKFYWLVKLLMIIK